MKFFTEIISNNICDRELKDGFYELEIVKKRSPEQHRLYWGLMEFFSIHSPEYLMIETKDDSHEFFKFRLGQKIYNNNGELVNMKPVSTKFSNMGQDDFNTYMGRMTRIVCFELGADKMALDYMFNEFMQEKKNK